MNNLTLIIGIGLCIIILIIIYLFCRTPQDSTIDSEQIEVMSSEDNPYIKQINQFRNTFIATLMSCLGIVWFVSPQNITYHADLTDWNSNLFTIFYGNHLVRCYINWETNLIRITYSFRNDNYRLTKSKKFRLKNNTIDFEKFTNWVTNIYRIILLNSWSSMNDKATECLAQGRDIAADEELTDVDFDNMIFEIWQNFVIHNNKKEIEKDLISFSKLSAYVMRYCPKQLKKL